MGMTYDYAVIGGGIVGLATAMKLLERKPGASLVLIEKEAGLGRHQTGHNSGVIHSGIYYEPGSLKADLCRRGAKATKEFCKAQDIPFEECGKMIVATGDTELRRLGALAERAGRNGIEVERLDGAELRRREPHVRGLAALFVKETGIVDYRLVSERMGSSIRASGGQIELGAAVTSVRETPTDVEVVAGGRNWQCRRLVACAGLQSDRIASLAGLTVRHRIIPFRGEYFCLPKAKSGIVKSLIYPVPDPALPFLGVHLTRMIDGSVTVGPNAVLGFSREGYAKFSFKAGDVLDFARSPGFWKMLWSHRRFAVSEMSNSLWRAGYLKECRKYCPDLVLEDLQPWEAGIRAQAMRADGGLIHDFLFIESARMLHVCNAPSPAATSAIPIGEMIAAKCG
jgi:L-2-hydroxyglutarate oxidase